MTPTPRTEAFCATERGLGTGYYQALDFARQLEREITELNQRLIDRTDAYGTKFAEQVAEIAAIRACFAEASRDNGIASAELAELLGDAEAMAEALDSLAGAVGNMRNPKTTEDVAMMCCITLGPVFECSKNVLKAYRAKHPTLKPITRPASGNADL